MNLIALFLAFLGIGTAAFGGGYGVISLIRDVALSRGWLTEEELLNFIAVAESTPGPIAVNMATFVGASQGGVLGAFLATLGVILPAFIIMFIVVKYASKLMKYAPVEAALSGIRPAVVGLILSVAVTMFLSRIVGFSGFGGDGGVLNVDWIAVAIFATVAAVTTLYRKLRGKKLSPILLICVSAVLGAVMYSL